MSPLCGTTLQSSSSDESGNSLAGSGIMVTGAQTEILEDDTALAQLEGAGQAEFSQDAVTKAAEEAETGEKAGLKVYYEYDGDIKDAGAVSINLVVNSDWGYGNASESFETGSDEKGTYIWYECDLETVNYLSIPVWYLGEGSFKITEIAAVKEEKIDENDTPVTPPEENEDFEVTIEPDEWGNYHVPEDKDAPMGIKADLTFSEGAGGGLIIFDDWSGGSKWINRSQGEQIILFDEDTDFEKLSFSSEITKAEQVTFLYWEQEDGTQTEEKGIFALPDYQAPAAMRYTCGSGDYSNSGVAIYIGYKNSDGDYNWTNVSWWIPVGKETVSDYIFDQQEIQKILDRAIGENAVSYIRFDLGENDDDLDEVVFYYDHRSEDDLQIPEDAVSLDTEVQNDLEQDVSKKVPEDENQTEEKEEIKDEIKEEIKEPEEDDRETNGEENGSDQSEDPEENPEKDPEDRKEEGSDDPKEDLKEPEKEEKEEPETPENPDEDLDEGSDEDPDQVSEDQETDKEDTDGGESSEELSADTKEVQ